MTGRLVGLKVGPCHRSRHRILFGVACRLARHPLLLAFLPNKEERMRAWGAVAFVNCEGRPVHIGRSRPNTNEDRISTVVVLACLEHVACLQYEINNRIVAC